MKYIRYHMLTMLLYLGVIVIASAQTKVEVLTKTVEKNFGYIPGNTIKVIGESARINVTGWDRSEVKVVIKLISKGLTKKEAEVELEFQKFLIKTFDEEHVIKNFLLIPNELKELKTIQETEIQVFVPFQAMLYVENQYGETSMNNLEQKFKVKSEYGYIELSQVDGDFELESNFGDLLIGNASGEMKLTLHLTKTTVDNFNGKANIKSNLGDVSIKRLTTSSSVKVNSTKSDVRLEIDSIDDYSWFVKSKYGALKAPSLFLKYNEAKSGVKLEYGSAAKPKVTVTTDFGEIDIIEL
ncbi:MAG: DUF4097 family beta strand repeat-containing protein [Bacteroidota bacterium]